MNKLRILLVIDEYGWSFDFVARGIQKYGKHNYIIKKYNEVTIDDIKTIDVLFVHSATLWKIMKRIHPEIFVEIVNRKLRCCIGQQSNPDWGTAIPIDDKLINAIGCISTESYDYFVKRELRYKTSRKVYLTLSGVDELIFKPNPQFHDNFVIGWAGNPDNPVKRFPLIFKLGFTVQAKTDWGYKCFIRGRSQQPMADYYNTIDVFINISSTEGVSQTILEAMASGLPVIATAVGGTMDVVDREWLVPANPESEMIRIMKEKIQLLKDDVTLRKIVGEQNREKILKDWIWSIAVRKYEDMFEGE